MSSEKPELLNMHGKGNLKVLVLGDIVARIGRDAVKKALPKLIKKENPDLVIGNAENLAYGRGVNLKSINEMREAGISVFTSGNHVWNMAEGVELLKNPDEYRLLRPANYPKENPGVGHLTITIGAYEILIINLIGRVFMRENTDSPFAAFDEIMLQYASRNLAAVLVDFHGEATSERVAFGWYVDGRATAIWGTHTHVPTADARILTKGTFFMTDVGMTGFYDGVIGVAKEPVIRGFLRETPQKFEYPEEGTSVLNAVLLKIDAHNKKVTDFKTLTELI